MATLHISLPDRLKAFVEGKVADGPFKDASEYLASLVTADAQGNARAQLDALLLEGFDSEDEAWDESARTAIRGSAKANR